MYDKRNTYVVECKIDLTYVILGAAYYGMCSARRVGRHVASGPGRFLRRKKRPGAICSRMREKLRKITVKSLVYVEMKYTAEVFGTRLLLHIYTSVHG